MPENVKNATKIYKKIQNNQRYFVSGDFGVLHALTEFHTCTVREM